MAIDFDVDVFPLFSTKLLTDSAYSGTQPYVQGNVGVADPAATVFGGGATDDIALTVGGAGPTNVAAGGTGTLDDLISAINTDGTVGTAATGLVADSLLLADGTWVLTLTSTAGTDLTVAEGTADSLLANLGLTAGTYSTGTIPTDNMNQQNEQRILVTIETLRSHIATLRDPSEAKLLQTSLAKILAAMTSTPVYDDLMVTVLGNVPSPSFAIGAQVVITTVSGTDTITLATGGSASATAAEINTAITNASEVEAFVNARTNKLGFWNTTGNVGVEFTLGAGTGGVLNKAGITPATYKNAVARLADNIRDISVEAFVGEIREPIL